jgi:O-antigen ligase
MFEETYDSPHNEWLQYLFTTGILGFVGYYGMVKCALWSGFGIGKRTYSYPGEDLLNQISLMGVALAYGIQAYTIQSFVNISVPITVPYVIMSIAICACIGRRKRSADQAGSETNI